MSDLILPVKRIYFEQMRSGDKIEEFRLVTPYWIGRLCGKKYDRVIVTMGYPARDDADRRLVFPWRGYHETTITHPHFGADPVRVFAILVWP